MFVNAYPIPISTHPGRFVSYLQSAYIHCPDCGVLQNTVQFRIRRLIFLHGALEDGQNGGFAYVVGLYRLGRTDRNEHHSRVSAACCLFCHL